MLLKTRKLSQTLLLVLLAIQAFAQPSRSPIEVIVSMDHQNWTYQIGEKVKFNVQVLEHGNLVKDAKIKYEIGPEKMDPIKEESITLKDGKIELVSNGLKTAGFLRCIVVASVNGNEYRGLATAGFEPEKIQPTVTNPSDFDSFWKQAMTDLAKIPMDAIMTLIPERCTETVNVYHLNLQNTSKNSRLYGILCIPKKEGKYPALLKVPGAGVRQYYGDVTTAEKGIITLEIGIHGIPVTMDPSVYNDLRYAALDGYWAYDMDNKDRFYYKRVYLGCIRANDFLVSLPQFDGQNLAVTGGSQGGALSIITAGLDKRVKWLGAFYPALSDVTGYLHGRAGGWPHYFSKDNVKFNNYKEKLETVPYYDVVNFARRIKIPGNYMWGYNDETCPPTSMYASYNVITAPKELALFYDTGHWTYREERDQMTNWLVKNLTGKN